MPNINVRKAMDRIQVDINKTGKHIVQHSGIDAKDARFIINMAEDIETTARQIREIAERSLP